MIKRKSVLLPADPSSYARSPTRSNITQASSRTSAESPVSSSGFRSEQKYRPRISTRQVVAYNYPQNPEVKNSTFEPSVGNLGHKRSFSTSRNQLGPFTEMINVFPPPSPGHFQPNRYNNGRDVHYPQQGHFYPHYHRNQANGPTSAEYNGNIGFPAKSASYVHMEQCGQRKDSSTTVCNNQVHYHHPVRPYWDKGGKRIEQGTPIAHFIQPSGHQLRTKEKAKLFSSNPALNLIPAPYHGSQIQYRGQDISNFHTQNPFSYEHVVINRSTSEQDLGKGNQAATPVVQSGNIYSKHKGESVSTDEDYNSIDSSNSKQTSCNGDSRELLVVDAAIKANFLRRKHDQNRNFSTEKRPVSLFAPLTPYEDIGNEILDIESLILAPLPAPDAGLDSKPSTNLMNRKELLQMAPSSTEKKIYPPVFGDSVEADEAIANLDNVLSGNFDLEDRFENPHTKEIIENQLPRLNTKKKPTPGNELPSIFFESDDSYEPVLNLPRHKATYTSSK